MSINDINNLIVRFMAAESTLEKNRKEIIKNCEETKHECRMLGIKYGSFKEADEAIRKIDENTNAVLRDYDRIEEMLNTIRPFIIAIIQKESGEDITVSSEEVEKAITLFDSLNLDNPDSID